MRMETLPMCLEAILFSGAPMDGREGSPGRAGASGMDSGSGPAEPAADRRRML